MTGGAVEGDPVPLEAEHAWPSDSGARLYVGFPTGEVWTVDGTTRRRIGKTIRADGHPCRCRALMRVPAWSSPPSATAGR